MKGANENFSIKWKSATFIQQSAQMNIWAESKNVIKAHAKVPTAHREIDPESG